METFGDRTILVVPAIGGLIVAPLVFVVAAEARGHGVPEVVLAVERQGGRIRPRVAIVKAFASAVTIGTGGSAGREGPIVQIGAAVGSTLGQALRLSDDQVRLLVAAGAAGGIAATFNAPIAGMFFAVEIILRRYTTRNFTAIIVSAVMASVIYSSILGDRAVVQVPQYRLHHVSEIGLYTLLGVAAAIASMAFVAVLYALEDGFDRLPLHNFLKPGLGGLAVGAIGLWSLAPLGAGTDSIERIVTGEYAARTLVLLLFAKMVATSLTLGSGGSGGVFAPSLFMGAAVGGAFGAAAHAVFPGVAEQPEAYAVVGMAAVFAAAARAPVTAVLIIFEMTRDYRLILPLMITVAVATVAAQVISRETIYTIKLIRRGVDIQRERTSYLLDSVSLYEIMQPIEALGTDVTVEDLSRRFAERNAQAVSITDSSGRMLGLITTRDIESRLASGDSTALAQEIAHMDFPSLSPEATAHEALTRAETADAGNIVVMSRATPRTVLGIVTRRDILRRYAELSRRPGEAAHRAAIASLQ